MGALLDYLNSIRLAANSAISANLEPDLLEKGEGLAGLASLASGDLHFDEVGVSPDSMPAARHVACESCQNCIPSSINPGAGWGRCKVSEKQGDYPRRLHICLNYEPIGD